MKSYNLKVGDKVRIRRSFLGSLKSGSMEVEVDFKAFILDHQDEIFTVRSIDIKEPYNPETKVFIYVDGAVEPFYDTELIKVEMGEWDV